MSTIPPILVKLQADVSGLKSGLNQAEAGIKNLDRDIKNASGGMASFAKQLKSVGAALGVAFAGQQIAQFAKQSIMASSNMEESLSKVNVVFGEAAGRVIEFSKTSAESMGMSSQAALEAALLVVIDKADACRKAGVKVRVDGESVFVSYGSRIEKIAVWRTSRLKDVIDSFITHGQQEEADKAMRRRAASKEELSSLVQAFSPAG
jgi:phage tail sheath protein FI